MLRSNEWAPTRGADLGAEAFFFGVAVRELLVATAVGPHHLEIAAEAANGE
jgi:hypothetical protein